MTHERRESGGTSAASRSTAEPRGRGRRPPRSVERDGMSGYGNRWRRTAERSPVARPRPDRAHRQSGRPAETRVLPETRTSPTVSRCRASVVIRARARGERSCRAHPPSCVPGPVRYTRYRYISSNLVLTFNIFFYLPQKEPRHWPVAPHHAPRHKERVRYRSYSCRVACTPLRY